ncbi:MAG: hypothetical protein ILP17_03120 [Lachnospiraceae bacterium]|nr:hypothetical protein [Lachnospiraceae bacterium]
MKTFLKRIAPVILSVIILLSVLPAMTVRAEEVYDGEVIVYIALTASGAAAGDRGLVYNGPEYAENTPEIIAVTATMRAGETATVSLTLPEEITRIYDIAPVIYSSGDNVAFRNVDASVSLKVNGEAVDVISEGEPQPPLSWKDTRSGKLTAWRLYGGIEEGGLMYAVPDAFKGATEIEYTVTINCIDAFGPAYEGEASVFVGFEGDLTESGDHGLIYNGPGDEGNCGDISAVTAMCGVGDTVTVSVTLPRALHHAYLVTPVIMPSEEDTSFSTVSAVVSLKVDGLATDLGPAPDPGAWADGIGLNERAWRLYGGANEEGTGTVGTALFAGATRIEYTITLVSAYEIPKEPEPEPEPEPEIIPEPEPDPGMTGEPMPADDIYAQTEPAPVPEEEGTNEALVRGIALAVFAVFLIVCGVALSMQKPAGDDEADKKSASGSREKKDENEEKSSDKVSAKKADPEEGNKPDKTEDPEEESDSSDKSDVNDEDTDDKKDPEDTDDEDEPKKSSEKKYEFKDEDDVDVEELLEEVEDEMPDEPDGE